METHNYTPNSHKYREEQKRAKERAAEKKVVPVVSGKVKTKKKSEIHKFTDIFVVEDVNVVKDYVFNDVIIPMTKDIVWSVFTNTLDMFLFGGSGRGDRRSNGGSKVSYKKFYDDRRDDRFANSSRVRDRFDFDDLVFSNRPDAQNVLDEMYNLIEQFGVVSVADMYDLAQHTAPYTANNYGWTSIRSAEVVRLRNGDYIIKLPKCVAID